MCCRSERSVTKGARRLFNVPPPPAPTRPRGSSFDLLQRFLPCAVFIIKGKKLGSVFPQRKRFETRSKCIMRRVTYTYLYEGGRRGAIERNFFSWNFLVFSFSSKKNHVFLVLARELAMKISSKCDNRAGESEKIQKRIATVRARGLRRTWHEGHASRVREVECTEIERRWERAARTMTQKIQTGRGEADSRNASFLRFLPYALNISLA